MAVVVERDRFGRESVERGGVEKENPRKDDPETDRRPSLQWDNNYCI